MHLECETPVERSYIDQRSLYIYICIYHALKSVPEVYQRSHQHLQFIGFIFQENVMF